MTLRIRFLAAAVPAACCAACSEGQPKPYSGLMAASDARGDLKYRDAMMRMAQGFGGKQRKDRPCPNADDIGIGLTCLELYLRAPRFADTRHLDTLQPLQTLKPGDDRLPWWWCDALYDREQHLYARDASRPAPSRHIVGRPPATTTASAASCRPPPNRRR